MATAQMTGAQSESQRAYAEVIMRTVQAFLECSDEVREVVKDMIEVCKSPDADDDERFAAALTLKEALFPDGDFGDPGRDLACDSLVGAKEHEVVKRLKTQEENFSQRLDAVMRSKNMNQMDLAERAGVGQPAISMMLSRECRPQRRTVDKLASALGVEPHELWPEY